MASDDDVADGVGEAADARRGADRRAGRHGEILDQVRTSKSEASDFRSQRSSAVAQSSQHVRQRACCCCDLGIAVVSVAHGAHTLFGMFGGPGSGVGPGGLGQTAAQFAAIGLPGFPLAVARRSRATCSAACCSASATSRAWAGGGAGGADGDPGVEEPVAVGLLPELGRRARPRPRHRVFDRAVRRVRVPRAHGRRRLVARRPPRATQYLRGRGPRAAATRLGNVGVRTSKLRSSTTDS